MSEETDDDGITIDYLIVQNNPFPEDKEYDVSDWEEDDLEEDNGY